MRGEQHARPNLPPLPRLPAPGGPGVARRTAGPDPLGDGLGIGATHPTLPAPGDAAAVALGYPARALAAPGWALRLWGDLLPPPPTLDEFPAPPLPPYPTVAAVAAVQGGSRRAGVDAETGAVDPEVALAVFAHTYWSCVERGWGLPMQPRRRFVGPLPAPRRTALARTAATLAALGVPPAAWIAARFVAWQRCRVMLRGKGRGPAGGGAAGGASGGEASAPYPAFAWVMAHAAVDRYVEDAAAGASATPATVPAPPVLAAPIRALLTAWQGARTALALLPAGTTREDAERAVRGHLGPWGARLAEARAALDTEARTVTGLALRGEWVWPLPVNAIGTRSGIGVSVAELAADAGAAPAPAPWRKLRDASTAPALPRLPPPPPRRA